ncbi:hypothetical protein J2847_005932 [Azospirillum agricola]|uniref:hypothetical protein n=1 Tax=Azospirillum agricola TaxID=1720247 RepID=UPI001AE2A83A|nr:hypothetical protein [Azospirillum agricola]MBP2232601.1 hypothetical protein [Azospirillum agricola]
MERETKTMADSIALGAEGRPLKPGEVRFYQAAVPPLPAGGYRLRSVQTVTASGVTPVPTYESVQPFTLTGPRFALAPTDLQSVYPPANQTGVGGEVLPNVVLRRRTLPWERTIDGAPPPAEGGAVPWMALLTVTADELGGEAGAVAAPSPVRACTVEELLRPREADILPPALPPPDAAEAAGSCLVLDLDLALFQAVAPEAADLPWLAHVREVDTDHKEALGLAEDGFFSVVVGNRLLQTGAVNYQFLVSLEGHRNALAPNVVNAKYRWIRLVSLAWWRVAVGAGTGDFLQIMQALPARGGVGLPQLPHTPFPEGDEGAALARKALSIGYTPLRNRMRAGETTTSWYRGPASPVPLEPDELGPYFYSDRAIRYDPETALFDVSYACAWQIGRLLALSDSPFARQLYEWRRQGQRAALTRQGMAALAAALPAAAASAGLPTEPGEGDAALLAAHALAAGFARAHEGDGGPPARIRREDRGAPASAGGEGDPLDLLLDRLFGGLGGVNGVQGDDDDA